MPQLQAVTAVDFHAEVREAIRDADRARMGLAALDRSRLRDPSLAYIAADVAGLWDRYRITLAEVQLAMSPRKE